MFHHEDQRERLRAKVTAEQRFQLYRRYSERSAAEHIGVDYSTLKRKRRAGLVPFVDLGGGSVGYMGYHIADIILFGVNAKDEQVNSETNACPDTQGGVPGRRMVARTARGIGRLLWDPLQRRQATQRPR
jgi:hypothetical protein